MKEYIDRSEAIKLITQYDGVVDKSVAKRILTQMDSADVDRYFTDNRNLFISCWRGSYAGRTVNVR